MCVCVCVCLFMCLCAGVGVKGWKPMGVGSGLLSSKVFLYPETVLPEDGH